ncbi:transmembrane protein [Arabidopsis thaliana]|uniref:Transmembrane protein n=1 Tax=Arabidopsis thaliana TaxID=3702 RepID=Q56YJ7_ARATH|nr:uncharacterized protein AT5G35375 [Arabidopsis thaliana]AED93960.1 transmembrane protein [Arabidopsis thaliana]BAD94123.1 hypothetical protein [Arabidopsis thaliana]|eukprot:NP_001078637.1 transmembrane protein [Arabidopsis thaliana]
MVKKGYRFSLSFLSQIFQRKKTEDSYGRPKFFLALSLDRDYHLATTSYFRCWPALVAFISIMLSVNYRRIYTRFIRC